MLSVFAKAIVCSDCESGNKSAFEALKERLETGTEDPELASLGHMELLKNPQAKCLIETPKLMVIPRAVANDGTALKPATSLILN